MRWALVKEHVWAACELVTDELYDQVDAGVDVEQANWRLRRLGLLLVEHGSLMCDLAELDVTRLEAARLELVEFAADGPAWDDLEPVMAEEATGPDKLYRLVYRLERAIPCWVPAVYDYLFCAWAALMQRLDLPGEDALSALGAAMHAARALHVAAARAYNALLELDLRDPNTPGQPSRPEDGV